MKEKIEISPYGNMLVYKKGYTSDFVMNVIAKNGLEGLRIFDHLDRLESLNFLKEYTFLKKLDIDCINDHDYSFLSSLPNLKHLGIGASIKKLNTIDLSNQHELQILGINWRKKIIGLESCTKLSSLTLVEFKEKDLKKIESLKSLIFLRIKTGSIESLQGIDELINLQSLTIANCKKLQSIKAVNHLSKLKELYFEECSNINDYGEVRYLPGLETLSLIDCGKIQSLKFVEQFPSLNKLSLLGNTVISDGDLIPAKRISLVEHKHYSHYNVKLENPSYNQNIKKNLDKLKKWLK